VNRHGLPGIDRQVEDHELRGGATRRDHPWRDKTITAFETPGKRIGVELRLQPRAAGLLESSDH
jgi:hypothetical protein